MWPETCCSACLGVTDPATLVKFGGTQTDAFGRLRVSNPFTLFDSHQRFSLDDNFVSNVASGGSVTFLPTQSSANLTVTNTANSFAARETKWVFTYQPGKSLLIMATFVLAPVSDGNLRQRVGYFGQDNGIFLELRDQVYIVKRSNVTGTVTETYIPQTQWNYDPLVGTGISGYTLDITKAQIFWIDIEWLGVGNVRTGFVYQNQFVMTHIFQHANFITSAYLTTGSLPVRYEIQSLTESAPPTSNLTQICSTVISEGGYDQPFRLFSNIYNYSKTMTAGTWYPVHSIRLAPGRLDAIVQIKQVDVAMTSADTLHWALWSNVTDANLTGESFVPHGFSQNVLIDQSATAIDVSTCIQVAAGLVSGTNQSAGQSILELGKYYSQLARDSFSQTSKIYTLAFYSVIGISGSPVTAQVLLSWNELL